MFLKEIYWPWQRPVSIHVYHCGLVVQKIYLGRYHSGSFLKPKFDDSLMKLFKAVV